MEYEEPKAKKGDAAPLEGLDGKEIAGFLKRAYKNIDSQRLTSLTAKTAPSLSSRGIKSGATARAAATAKPAGIKAPVSSMAAPKAPRF